MVYRTVICVLLVGVVGVGLACGDVARQDEQATRIVETPVASTEGTDAQADSPASHVGDPALTLPPTGGSAPSESMVARPPSPYFGDTSVEEKIFSHPIVIRATMISFSSDIMLYPDNTFRPVLKFSLSVSEYLKGAGPSNIVAVWFYGRSYNTREEADDEKMVILAERDGQWDDRQAIFFLVVGASGLGPLLETQPQLANQYILGLGDRSSPDDRYSLHSKTDKNWLPASSSTGDSQEFLLDLPVPQGSATPTITLGYLKNRITEITNEINGGDGSEAYKECVRAKYRHIRNTRNFPEVRGGAYTVWNIAPSLVSGQPAHTVLDQREAYGGYPDTKITLRLEGSDSALFEIEDSASTPVDRDKDGTYDAIKYDQLVNLVRPIPKGEYKFDLKEFWPSYMPCNYVISNEWTVTVSAHSGVIHELFFDPVAVGIAVSAGASNGVLKPVTFTDANGGSATISSISYESSTVKVEVTPDAALAGHIVDFIELDGTVSLSLDVADATGDLSTGSGQAGTLSWSVSSQPWEDGDMLMVRIREAR